MLKVGFWQIAEALTVVFSLYVSFTKHGQNALTKESYVKFLAQPDIAKQFSYVFVFVLYMLLGPVIAWNGGCRGIYMLVYSCACFLMCLYGMSLATSEKGLNKKYNFYQSALTMAGYNILLYLGGFWTVTQ